MRNLRLNYDTLIRVSRALSKSRDPEEIIRMSVESIKSALDIKGCAGFGLKWLAVPGAKGNTSRPGDMCESPACSLIRVFAPLLASRAKKQDRLGGGGRQKDPKEPFV